jgi:hypothetical protein
VVYRIFEHVGLDASHLVWNAVGATDNGAEGKYDAVEACSCVVAELEVKKPSKGTVFCL